MKKNVLTNIKTKIKTQISNKSKLYKFFIITISALCSIIIFSIILLIIVTNKTTIVFYNIPQNQQDSITKIIQLNFHKKFRVISLSDDIEIPQSTIKSISIDKIATSSTNSKSISNNPSKANFLQIVKSPNKEKSTKNNQIYTNLTKQLDKVQLIIVIKDTEIEEYPKIQKKIVSFNENLLKGMPQSISETVTVQDNYINYLPLLFDMYQVDINYNFLLDSTLKNISIFQDLDDFAEDLKSKIYTPIVLPFADTKEFLNIFGQMLESLTKPQEYKIFYNGLQEIYNKNKHDLTKMTQEIEFFLQQQTQDKSTSFSKTLFCFTKLIQDKKIKDVVLSQNLEENLYYLA